MDLPALLVFLALVVAVTALTSGDPIAWFRAEWRRMRMETFSSQELPGPTGAEEAAQRLELKQRALAKQMRRQGRHLFASKKGRRKAYTPVGTSPIAVPEAPRTKTLSKPTLVPMRRTGT